MLILFFVLVGILFCFLLALTVAFSRSRPSTAVADEPVSLVVCAHDEEQNLRALIPLLRQQRHPEFELIIVNDRSNDNTFDLLREAAAEDARIKVVTIDRIPDHLDPKKYAVTLGIRTARYERIVLTDADCRPASTQWLQHMTAGLHDGKQIVLGYSPYIKEEGLLNGFIRFETLFSALQYIGFAIMGMPYMGVGRNLAYTKPLFMDNKGFNSFRKITGGDDDLFVNRHATSKNVSLCIGKEALVYSFPKKSWRAFFRQKKRHLSVGRYYKTRDKLVLGLFMFSYIGTLYLGIGLVIANPHAYAVWACLAARVILLVLSLQHP
ncbi:MAG: glycosyltransferase [Bacteroidia bacterium]|nr:glycosyltransferase [Bacteroidia bacterium]